MPKFVQFPDGPTTHSEKRVYSIEEKPMRTIADEIRVSDKTCNSHVHFDATFYDAVEAYLAPDRRF